MPLLAVLLRALLMRSEAVMIALWSTDKAIRLAAVLVLAGLYIAAVTAFTVFISPLLSQLFSTGYGNVLGLAFPPVAGTVIVGYGALWVTLVGMRYYKTFTAIAVK